MGTIRTKLTIKDWEVVDNHIHPNSLSHFVHSKSQSLLKGYDCIKRDPPMLVERSLRIDGDIADKIECVSSQLGITAPEFIRRFILEPVIGKNVLKLPS